MGTITVSGQLNTFLVSLIFGAAYCLLYDILRTLHKSIIKTTLLIFITDVFYWIIITLTTCSFALLFAKGEIRGYWLFGIVVGFLVFRLTLSRFAIIIFDFLLLILRFLKKHISRFIDFIFDKINLIFEKIPLLFKKIFKRKKKSLERV